MFSLEEMRKIQEAAKQKGEAVRLMSDDGDTPVKGSFYTVSPDFTNGDRSWIENFWEVISVNGPNVFVRIHKRAPISGENVERFFPIADRAWYNADDAWAAVNQRSE